MYSLPRYLNFNIVKNLEELSSLEMSSFLSEQASDISISLWVKVVWEVNFIRRATKEEETVMNDLKTIEKSLKEAHSLISFFCITDRSILGIVSYRLCLSVEEETTAM